MIAGNVMSRRAIYMYGSLLPRNERGAVNAGLGQTNSTGTNTLILPTDIIHRTDIAKNPHVVDGVKMEFQMTPGTEAPAEMNTYFPDFQALWMAENSTNTMHNILTLRSTGSRCAEVGELPQRDHRTLRRQDQGQVPEPPLANVEYA